MMTIRSLSLSSSAHHQDLHSFPTRRSSDLSLLSRLLARSVLIGAVNLNLQYARLLSAGVRWMVMVLAVAMALDHLARSEEHMSELQSPVHLVCRLLLEKKNTEDQDSHRHEP